jgi:hypothetical protein
VVRLQHDGPVWERPPQAVAVAPAEAEAVDRVDEQTPPGAKRGRDAVEDPLVLRLVLEVAKSGAHVHMPSNSRPTGQVAHVGLHTLHVEPSRAAASRASAIERGLRSSPVTR